SAIAAFCRDHGPLGGVIHAAGLLRDGLYRHKTDDDLRAVLAPKTLGLLALDLATRDQPLDYFVAFSSVAAVFGNVGQTDYAAANAFMDGYMRLRAAQVRQGRAAGRSLSINWPLWADGGMQIDEPARQRLSRATSMAPLPSETGLLALSWALAGEAEQCLALHGQAEGLSRLMSSGRMLPQAQPAETAPAPLAAERDEGDDGALREKVEAALTREVSQLLQVPAQELDLDAQLQEFGFESISLTQFGNLLNTRYGLALSPTQFFETPTLRSLACHLLDHHHAE
ncbi:beta-ketoacyl reductase, partial [Chromobacterium alticapitis]|uniref:beta-ketoacyl reductase n=1 Tax=Chromobacterium alticapitis TaxID=2073169 RepID=UPI0018ECB757